MHGRNPPEELGYESECPFFEKQLNFKPFYKDHLVASLCHLQYRDRLLVKYSKYVGQLFVKLGTKRALVLFTWTLCPLCHNNCAAPKSLKVHCMHEHKYVIMYSCKTCMGMKELNVPEYSSCSLDHVLCYGSTSHRYLHDVDTSIKLCAQITMNVL